MQSLLFIPDICGFTSFVKEVEIRHSQHIITELLELLDKENKGLFNLAEVEGDALFFHQDASLIKGSELTDTIRRMHEAFHAHLDLYRHKRVCNCGACTSASNLELKFILHQGDCEFTTIKDSRKPFGPAVIEVHRLLKAHTEENEYVLATDEVMKSVEYNRLNQLGPSSEASEEFDGEEIHYKVFALERKPATNAKEIKYPQLEGIEPIEFEVVVNRSIDEVYQYLTDMDKRIDWSEGIEDLQLVDGHINKLDSVHTCVINGRDVAIKTLYTSEDEGMKTYIEETDAIPVIKTLTSVFQMVKEDAGTLVRACLYIKPKGLLGFIPKYFLSRNLKKGLPKSLEKLKGNLESLEHRI